MEATQDPVHEMDLAPKTKTGCDDSRGRVANNIVRHCDSSTSRVTTGEQASMLGGSVTRGGSTREVVPTLTLSDLGQTEEIIPLIPKILRLLQNLENTLGQPEIEQYLSGDNPLHVKQFLKDEEFVRRYLVDQGIVPSDLVETFINAEIVTSAAPSGNSPPTTNVFVDLKKHVCSPQLLENVIRLPVAKRYLIGRVSQELCNLNHSLVPTLVDGLLRQSDASSFIGEVLNGVQELSTYDAGNALSDMVIMLRTITSLRMFQPLVEAVPLVGNLPDVIEDTVAVAENVGSSQSFADVMELVAPLLGGLLDDREFANRLVGTARSVDSITDFLRRATTRRSYIVEDVVSDPTRLRIYLNEVESSRRKVNQLFNLEISPQKLRTIAILLEDDNWHEITCQSPGLTSIFPPSSNTDTLELRQNLQDLVCRLSQRSTTSDIDEILDWRLSVAKMDATQKARNIEVFEYFTLIGDVLQLTQDVFYITNKVEFFISVFGNRTSDLGRRVSEALNVKFETDDSVTLSAPELVLFVHDTVAKAEELQILASPIRLAGNILKSAENDFIELRSVITNPAALAAVLLGNDLTAELVDRLLGLPLNTADLLNMVVQDNGVTRGLCTGSRIVDALGIPNDLGLNVGRVNDIFCRGVDLGSHIDIQKLLAEQLGQLVPAYMMYGDWWQDSQNDIIDLVTSITDLATHRTTFDSRVLLKLFYHLIDSVGVAGRTDMSKSIPTLLGFLERKIVKPPYFLDDLLDLSQGLLSMSIFTREIPITGRVGDYTKDTRVVQNLLENEIHLSPLVSSSLMDSEFKVSLAYNIKDVSFSGEVCGPAVIRQFLKLPDLSDSQLQRVTNVFCSLSRQRTMRLAEVLVPEIEVGRFLQHMLDLSPTYLLSSSNLTEEETSLFARTIGPLGSQLGTLVGSVMNYSSDGSESSLGNTLRAFGRSFCDDPEAFSFGNYGASILSSDAGDSGDAPEPRWTPAQLQDMRELKLPFCVDTYKYIVTLPGVGPLLWAFLKPLTQGKVLFAPNTTATRAIMEEVWSVFRSVETVRNLAQTWIDFAKDGVTNSSSLTNSSKLLEALRTPLVSGAVRQATGVGGEQLIDQLMGVGQFSAGDINQVTNVARMVYNLTLCLNYGLEGFNTENEMEIRADSLTRHGRLFAGVTFLNFDGNGRQKRSSTGRLGIPKHAKYKLRLNVDHVVIPGGLFKDKNQAGPNDDFLDDLRYLWGFVFTQDLIDHAIIKLQFGNDTVLPKVDTQAFPYPCYDQDDFMVWSSFVVVIILLFSWLCMMAVGINSGVSEKELGIEDTLLVMGMKGGINRLAWFTNTLLGMIFLSAFVTALIRAGNLVPHSDGTLIFIWLATYSVSIVMLCYLVSALVHRTNLASLFGLLIYLILCIPFIILHSMDVVFLLSFNNKILMSLSVTSAFCFGANELIETEKNGYGITWQTAFQQVGNTFPFFWSCIMSLVDCAIYGLMAWYISNTFPGKFGIPQPWYFPVSPYYWGCKQRQRNMLNLSKRRAITQHDNEDVPGEEEPHRLPIGISLSRLTKIFNGGSKSKLTQIANKLTGKKPLVAVNSLSVNFFEGQITAFLGHNGAGKSTCIHMLTGLIKPTSGTAFIGGYDIQDGFKEISKTLGYCPQHDVLFDYMTIKEHFSFYVQIKGSGTSDESKEEVEKMLDLTGLRSFKNIRVSSLSGGQRRRVSVGNAFIGGSKVIILDEPTSGVDPAARRMIWNIIAKHKKGRTIVLCTHHLDEADALGDRIVMMHQGRLICSGSSMWLKSQYGSGYHLTISKVTERDFKNDTRGNINPSGWDTTRVLSFVRKQVPGARLVEDIGSEVTIVLPNDRTQMTRFQQLFVELEKKKAFLHIDKYGIADSTLEEVFLKVTRSAEEGRSLDPERLRAWVLKPGSNPESSNTSSSGSISRSSSQRGLLPFHSSLNRSSGSSLPLGTTAHDLQPENTSLDTGLGNSTPSMSGSLSRSVCDSESLSSTTWDRAYIEDDFLETTTAGSNSKLSSSRRSRGVALKWRQFKALLLKRFHHHKRDLRSHVSQIVLPSVFVLLAMVATWFKPSGGAALPFRLDAAMYGPDQEMFFSVYEPSTFVNQMLDTVTYLPGMGTLCMGKPDGLNYWQDPLIYRNCRRGKAVFKEVILPPEKRQLHEAMPNCSCENGPWICPEGAVGLPPPQLQTHSFDRLVNLTGYRPGVEQYLLRTFDSAALAQTGGTFGGWTFDRDGDQTLATVWYENKGLHSLPAYYNGLSNMALRANVKMTLPTDDPSQYGITTYNHPFNPTNWPISKEGVLASVSDSGVTLTILIAYCFVPASYIIYVINERIHQEKRLQFITGVGTALYWFSAFLWDMMTYSVTVMLTIGITRAFNLHIYTYGENLLALAVALMLFGWATIPLMYLLSRWFSNPTVGYVAAFIINLAIGINSTASIFFLMSPIFNSRPEIVLARQVLSNALLVFPQFCLGDSLVKLSFNQIIADISARLNTDTYASPFSEGVLFYHYLSLGMEGAIFFIVHLVVEFNISCTESKSSRLANYDEDDDVGLERQRVNENEANKDILVLYNLTKCYRSGIQSTLAVDNLCVGVPRAECFGLLGVNGAGKTTSFKMITGEIQPTSGTVLLKGSPISDDVSNMSQNVGYCPQFDALDDQLTGEEMIYYFCRLRGIMEGEISQICSTVVRKFQLGRHIRARVGTYSAGNKRKLSTALALVGDPDLVLLDEPTTGMDPGTRRLVWDNIIEVIKDNRSVILTSHSMEECDALCTRMAIMVNGTFKCLGSSQHLKDKYGSGYTISTRIAGTVRDVRKVIRSILQRFPGAKIKDQHLRMVEFSLPSKKSTLSAVFRGMEREKDKMHIENYSVTQTTLDQVFLYFARQQTDNRSALFKEGSHHLQHSIRHHVEPDLESVSEDGTVGEWSISVTDAPPSYHSGSIAPNPYENPHIPRTLRRMPSPPPPPPVGAGSNSTTPGESEEVDESVVDSWTDSGGLASDENSSSGVAGTSSGNSVV